MPTDDKFYNIVPSHENKESKEPSKSPVKEEESRTQAVTEQSDLPESVTEQSDLPESVTEQSDLPESVTEQSDLSESVIEQSGTSEMSNVDRYRIQEDFNHSTDGTMRASAYEDGFKEPDELFDNNFKMFVDEDKKRNRLLEQSCDLWNFPEKRKEIVEKVYNLTEDEMKEAINLCKSKLDPEICSTILSICTRRGFSDKVVLCLMEMQLQERTEQVSDLSSFAKPDLLNLDNIEFFETPQNGKSLTKALSLSEGEENRNLY